MSARLKCTGKQRDRQCRKGGGMFNTAEVVKNEHLGNEFLATAKHLDPCADVDHLSIEQLGQRAAVLDCKESWRAICIRSREHLIRYAQGLGVCDDDAEDLVQDTLIRAWERRALYSPEYTYRSWIRTILFRVAASVREKDGNRDRIVEEHQLDGLSEWTASFEEKGEDATIQDIYSSRVLRLLDRVSEEDRALLEAWSKRIPSKDVARARGIPHGTARSRLHRAKNRLVQVHKEAKAVGEV